MTSWDEELLVRVTEICNDSVKKWTKLIDTIGVPMPIRTEWCTTYLKALKHLTGEMYCYLEERQKGISKVIAELKNKITETSYHLGINVEFCKEVNLYQEEIKLKTYLTKLNDQIMKKQDEMTVLLERQDKVCTILNKPQKSLPINPLPTASELESFLAYVETLEREHTTREEEYNTIRKELKDLVKDTDYEPTNEFEKKILSTTDFMFVLNDENMMFLRQCEQSLKERVNNFKNEADALMESIKQLWKTLETNEKYCESFQEAHKGMNKQSIDAMKTEIKRLEALKGANLHMLIKRVQDQLVSKWDLCHFSSHQRKILDIPNEGMYTETMLTFFQNELNEVSKYYRDNQSLFEAITKFDSTWRRIDELEAESQTRFKNRGGKLLMEEKEYKTAKKRLCKLQQSIVKMVDSFYVNNNKEFTYEGKSIPEYFKSFETKYNIRREWCTTYLEKLEQMLSDKFNDLKEYEKNTAKGIAELRKKIHDAASIVGIKAECPVETSLYQEEFKLKAYLAHLEAIIAKRQNEVKKLQLRQDKVCSVLGKEPRTLKTEPLPSGLELESFLLYIESLEDECILREVKYNALKTELQDLAEQIDYEPANEFEANILSCSHTPFIVNDRNMLYLTNFEKTLKQHASNIKTKVCFYMESISELWSILDIDTRNCVAFQNAHHGLKKQHVNAMQREFKRLEELKKGNLKTLIQQLRKQLIAQWDLCHVSDQQRMISGLMEDGIYTEEMFTRLQKEKRRVTKHYEENELLYKSISKFTLTWKQLNERSTNDLLRNKYSCQEKYLTEEKDRKQTKHILKKLHQWIVKTSDEYYTVHGKEFTYNGMSITSYLKMFDTKYEKNTSKGSCKLVTSKSSNHLSSDNRACKMLQVGPSNSWHQLSSHKDLETSLKSLVVACFRPYSIPANSSS